MRAVHYIHDSRTEINKWSHLTNESVAEMVGVLFENRPALFCYYKENETNNTRMQDTLFIDDFIDIMEQYFLY